MARIRMSLWVATFAAAVALCIPAAAQYDRNDQNRDRSDQAQRGDQDRDRGDQAQRGDQDRDRDRDNGAYNNNEQWRNSKAYQQGMKDGDNDRSHNRAERLNRHHWKNDQDRQAYQAGYYAAYRGNGTYANGDHDRDRRDRDNDRRDRDDQHRNDNDRQH